MPSGIYRALNIKPDEGLSVFLMIAQSIFLGIFYGSFDVGAQALFLETYDASMLGQAFLISGFCGIFLTSIYTFLQKRIRFSALSSMNLLFIAGLTFLLRYGFGFLEEKLLIFIIFVLMGPLNILALVGFWGTVGRMFSLRQGKRLFGLVDSGQVLGIIISSFAIPLLLTIGFQTRNTLLIASISIGLAVLFQIIITNRFSLNLSREVSVKKEKKTGFATMMKDKYIQMMSIFVILSMVAAFFVHYSFLAVTDAQYPDPVDLASFLGLFTGSMMIFIILIKTFVYGWLMKTYGLKLSIILSPILLGVFTIAAVVVGAIFGFTLAALNFALFFLIISLTKLFSRALKDSIEAPSFKLLYQSLDKDIRYDVQARVDGTINELAATAAGLILMILSTLKFFNLLSYSYALFVILVIWVAVAFNLYRRYKESLKVSLSKFRQEMESDTEADLETESIWKTISNDLTLARTFRSLDPDQYHSILLGTSGLKSEGLDPYILEIWYEQGIIDHDLALFKDIHPLEDSGIQGEYLSLVKTYNDVRNKKADLQFLVKSNNWQERLIAANLIKYSKDEEAHKLLMGLLRDSNRQVVLAAIRSIGSTKLEEAIPYLTEFLAGNRYFSEAHYTLKTFGNKTLDALEQAYHKTQAGILQKKRILVLMGYIPGSDSMNVLLSKLGEDHPGLLYQCLSSLERCDLVGNDKALLRLNQVLVRLLSLTAWNFAALASAGEEKMGDELMEALNAEVRQNLDFIYKVLSLIYDPQSILQVRENLESGTAEGPGFAMELLDLFIGDEIKPYLFPILDDLEPEEKFKQLELFYPIEKMNKEQLLVGIINRDYNQLGLWAKSCALRSFTELDELDLDDNLVAQLFHPSRLLKQSALLLANKIDPDKLGKIMPRLRALSDQDPEFEIRNILTNKQSQMSDLISMLKQHDAFRGVSGDDIYQFVSMLHKVEASRVLEGRYPIGIIASGNLKVQLNGTSDHFEPGDLFSAWKYWSDPEIHIESSDDAHIYLVDEAEWDQFVFDNPALAKRFVEFVKTAG